MFEEMHDIATQLVLKWRRHGRHASINATEDFTRLTLDTIALCSMGYRFNSFYREDFHPFLTAMTDFLAECGNRAVRLPLPAYFYRSQDTTYLKDINMMRKTAHDILQQRKLELSTGITTPRDLLARMLDETDLKTGEKMTEESIINNLITFLIAGHETTSGMLSFAMYYIIKHPEVYRKLQNEVDTIFGSGSIKLAELNDLQYGTAVSDSGDEMVRLPHPNFLRFYERLYD